MNVDTTPSHRNIQFKKCDSTYNDKLNRSNLLRTSILGKSKGEGFI